MVNGVELVQGARFSLVQGAQKQHLSYFKTTADGRLVFVDELTGKEKPLSLARFRKSRLDGTMLGVTSETVKSPLDPDVFADETVDGITKLRRAQITRKKKKYTQALTLRFYVKRFDDTPNAKKSTSKLEAFIKRHYDEGLSLGYGWQPSASEVRKAINACGSPCDRSLEHFLKPEVKRWRKLTPWHIAALDAMIDEYWGVRGMSPKEAIEGFLGKVVAENAARVGVNEPVAKVSRETARVYLNESENFERYARKYGLKMAQRRYRGRVPRQLATRPLERVQLDQTQIDTHINILDEDGNVVARKRPWLVSIVDECTRMFLAALLTFERPSTYTLMAAVKQMLTPKRFLIARYGALKGATNGYGKAITVLLDNGLENVNLTFQAFLAAIGMDLELAPKATPEAKPLVERAYDTLNKGVWHRAPGAVPFKPHEMKQRRLAPQEQADWSLDVAHDVMWGYLTHVYHLSVHSGIEMAPARKWGELLVKHGRPIVLDTSVVEDLCCDVRRAKLTAAGVSIGGMHFHDPDEVTGLLKSMLPFAAKRRQRRSAAQTGVVDVDVRVYPENCSVIGIVDSRSRRFVKLRNNKPQFSDGLSWRDAASIKADNDAANYNFLSDDELMLLKNEYYERMREATNPDRIVKLTREATRHSIARIGSIDEELVEATVTGFSKYDVPHAVAAFNAAETVPHHKMQVRGRRKSSKKLGQHTAGHSQNQTSTVEDDADQHLAQVNVEQEFPSENIITNSKDYLKILAEDLE